MKQKFMKMAVDLSEKSLQSGGGPFGAVIVKGAKVVGQGHNQVTVDNDPTEHAEIMAIHDACRHLKTYDLSGCEIYTSCEPCPMCLAAIMWARIEKIYFANTKYDAAQIGFDDSFFYHQLELSDEKREVVMQQVRNTHAIKVFQEWADKMDKTEY